jgi:hypothetical protein
MSEQPKTIYAITGYIGPNLMRGEWSTRRDDEDRTTAEYVLKSDVQARLAAAEKMTEAIDKLDLRNLVAGWNGEGREVPYTPHPSSLGVSLKTNAGTVYALDAARAAWEAAQ